MKTSIVIISAYSQAQRTIKRSRTLLLTIFHPGTSKTGILKKNPQLCIPCAPLASPLLLLLLLRLLLLRAMAITSPINLPIQLKTE